MGPDSDPELAASAASPYLAERRARPPITNHSAPAQTLRILPARTTHESLFIRSNHRCAGRYRMPLRARIPRPWPFACVCRNAIAQRELQHHALRDTIDDLSILRQ